MTQDQYQRFLEKNAHMLIPAARLIAKAKIEARQEGFTYEALLLFAVTDALHKTDERSAYMRYLQNLWGQEQ
jgi:hypothetical protein